ncbi:biotin--[acetyl-CoA-carboxylase] ligase [Frankia sp. AiPa1]|uniref:biotin--[acetyl-CoA-carboxylase] ligase n=1 Tax=Frankia sp. AiPa1 TaxID=573492 RepID=UPI00202B537A|nr:biotin--[acetyl-CoA-carboxylase] ligase [Frankia sp. AiPa1]MCL9757707.1 biotin--[acetyl-CoA-carboxylase] ligase [Frankia sp. AiPa1]
MPSDTSDTSNISDISDISGTRRPLDAARLAALLAASGLGVTVRSEMDSTNAALARVARGTVTDATLVEASRSWRGADAPRGLVLAAERQSAGRGRLDRTWESRPGAGITVSLLVRTAVEPARLGWLPMVVGTSLVSTVRTRAEVPAVLKWPNDVLVDGAKLAGILVELVPTPAVPPSVVIGFGLNVHARRDELPPRSTSLHLCGAQPARLDRTELLGALLAELADALTRWELDPGAARADYLRVCSTLGRQVRVELPGGQARIGTATDIDPEGRLVVDGEAYSAADVIHLR